MNSINVGPIGALRRSLDIPTPLSNFGPVGLLKLKEQKKRKSIFIYIKSINKEKEKRKKKRKGFVLSIWVVHRPKLITMPIHNRPK